MYISPEEYARRKGVVCPFCGSYNLSSSMYSDYIDEITTGAKIKCLDCNHSWMDIYKLSGYEIL